MNTTIVWFRQDLRLSDHPALIAALQGGQVLPVFIWSPEDEGAWAPGAASRWWLHYSLKALDQDLRRRGSRLMIRRGRTLDVLSHLVKTTQATALYWSRRYEPAAIKNEKAVQNHFKKQGLDVRSFNGSLLFEPWTLKTKAGNPFQVFTPFWKTCQKNPEPEGPLATPTRIPGPPKWPSSEPFNTLSLLPSRNWANGFRSRWTPGKKARNTK